MPARTFIEAIRDTLIDEMRRDESIIVLGEDVGKKGGVFLATDDAEAEVDPDPATAMRYVYAEGSPGSEAGG